MHASPASSFMDVARMIAYTGVVDYSCKWLWQVRLWFVDEAGSLISIFYGELDAETFKCNDVSRFKGIDGPPFFAAVNFYEEFLGINHHIFLDCRAGSIIGCFFAPVGSFRGWR